MVDGLPAVDKEALSVTGDWYSVTATPFLEAVCVFAFAISSGENNEGARRFYGKGKSSRL